MDVQMVSGSNSLLNQVWLIQNLWQTGLAFGRSNRCICTGWQAQGGSGGGYPLPPLHSRASASSRAHWDMVWGVHLLQVPTHPPEFTWIAAKKNPKPPPPPFSTLYSTLTGWRAASFQLHSAPCLGEPTGRWERELRGQQVPRQPAVAT